MSRAWRGTVTEDTVVPFDIEAIEAEEEDTDVGAVVDRVERTVHRRIQARRDAIELEAKTGFRQLVTWTVCGVLLGVALIGTVFYSPLFHIRTFKVVGAVHETAQDVRSAAGLPADATLVDVNTVSVERGIETLPWVRRAEVLRRLPWGLEVRIFERKAAAIVEADAVRCLVDAEGVVLDSVSAGAAGAPAAGAPAAGAPAPEGLPLLIGSARLPSPGMRLEDRSERMLLEVAVGLPAELAAEVSRVELRDGKLTLVLVGEVPVTLGSATGIADKASVLLAVLADLRHNGISAASIDVSTPASPAFVPVAPT